MRGVGLHDDSKENPVVGCRVDEVFKQLNVADVVVAVDPGGELGDGGHGLTNSAQIAWAVAPWADCADYHSSGQPHWWQVPMDIAICTLQIGEAGLDSR